MLNEDTKSLQSKIKVLQEENEILKSELEELDEEVTTQRTKGNSTKYILSQKPRDEITDLKSANMLC